MLTVEEVNGAEDSGLNFDNEGIGFDGFPESYRQEEINIFMELVALMNKQALESKRINPAETKTDNEKYTFRVWLIRLGMKGDKYKGTRKFLLNNLSGNSAFRTEDQMEAFKEKYKAKRKEEK